MTTVNTRIGSYYIDKTIGEGRYGKVKLARHKKTGKKVAIKIIDKSKMTELDMFRIQRELKVLTVLDHPNIVKLYKVLEGPETTAIVMEYCDGGDLHDYIADHGPLTLDQTLNYFRQIINGLLYCHQHYVIHRDVRILKLLFFPHISFR